MCPAPLLHPALQNLLARPHRLRECGALFNRVGDGLFEEHVFPRLQRLDRHRDMPVIGRRDDHRINGLVENFPVIEMRSRHPIGSLLDRIAVGLVHVTHRDNFVRAGLVGGIEQPLHAMCLPLRTHHEETKPEDTEVWQPAPTVVTPAAECGKPPSDAIVLFDGKNLDECVSAQDRSQPAKWTIADGILVVSKTAGNIETKRTFHNYQFHMEWRVPENITGSGQARGHSGLFLAYTGTGEAGYDLQVIDSYN